MNTYRQPQERTEENSGVRSETKRALGFFGVLALFLFAAFFVVPFAVLVWSDSFYTTLIRAAVGLVGVFLAGLAVNALVRFRMSREARALSFARDNLTRETEAFLARVEDENIRTRVFLPPAVRASEEPEQEEQAPPQRAARS